MRILVTGGAGFIGSNFIRYWFKNHPNDEIVNLDALTYAGNLANLADIASNPEYKYTFIKGDIRDRAVVARAMKGVDLVAHFAANSHVDRSIVEPGLFVESNVIGTQVLLEEARKANVWRFHHVSTDEVYGTLKVEGDEKFTEHTSYQPNNPYAASKAASDLVVRAYFKTYGLPATITNTSNNYGSYQFPEKYIPLVITRLMRGKKVRVHGKGEHIRDWLYVEDHCRAIETVLRKGKLGDVYLVGGRAPLSILEIAQRICRLMGYGDEMIEFVPDRPSNDICYRLDWSKINTELGWEPLHDIDTWLQKTIDWYKSNEDWWKPLEKTKFAWGEEDDDKRITPQIVVPPTSFPLNADKVVYADLQNGSVAQATKSSQLANFVNVQSENGNSAPVVSAEKSHTNAPLTYLEDNGSLPKATDGKTILIFGRGQLGTHYKRYYEPLGYNVVVAQRPEVDIRDFDKVKQVIEAVRPEFVINAAGVTNVDWAEVNKEETYQSNVIGADNIARAAQETGTYLVHLSSGCIFHSQNSADEKTEESIPNPLSYYMVSKVQAEEALLRRARENGLRVLILRPRQLLSAVPHAKNILAKMTIFTKFHDKDNSMTVIEDLMWVTDELVRRGRTGIYHVVNPGVTTPFRIAQMIREVINPDMQITQLSKEEIDAMYPVKRADTIMSTAKLNREGIFLIPIEQRVRQLLTVLRDNLLNEQARDILAETKAHDEARKSK